MVVEREQTDPVSDPVQVEVGVKSVGIVIAILRRVGSGALMAKGEVMVRVRVELERRTRVLVGV